MKLFLNFLLCLCLLSPFVLRAQGAKIMAGDLKCESLVNPLAIDNTSPHFSWIVYPGSNSIDELQTAYQLLVASSEDLLNEEDADLWNSEKVLSDASVFVPYDGKSLESRNSAYWKVRVWDKSGVPSAWSTPAYFGVGLLHAADWSAEFIGKPSAIEDSISPLLMKEFLWNGEGERFFLHVNSLGYHEVYLNGQSVSDAILSPAVSQFDKRSLVLTYDVTRLLCSGKNTLVVWLGKGWYQDELPGVVKGGPFLRLQLEVLQNGKWNTLIKTDQSWQAAESGYASFGTWRPYQFGGETIDASKLTEITKESLDILAWQPVRVMEIPTHIASPQMVELNRIQDSFQPISFEASGDSAWIFDMGTNFTGWTKISFPILPKGQRVRISYCDFLDENGQFRDGQYEDFFIASGKEGDVFQNKFNYKAYRYLKLSNLQTPPALADITGYLVRTDYSGNSSFACSDADLNAIHDMVHYTLQCLTIGGNMVDCPQIERLGYGGDGNASTFTVQTMYNMAPTYLNWMSAWADCMRDDGSMPHTAPNPYMAGGGPYWCGFIITASWQTYVNYGDKRLLERFYPYMQQWLTYVQKYTADGLLQAWPDTDYRQWYLGDWATPEGIDQEDKCSVDLVNNCYVAICYQTMAKIADLLGKPADKQLYLEKDEALRRKIHSIFFNAERHSYGTETQIDLVFPMLAGVTPANCVSDVKATLRDVTSRKFNGHLSTGLVGIPIITEYLTKEKEASFMYEMLKQHGYPGYLFMLDNGATTTWEHWNGRRSHIHNCYNGIGSWFYSALAGIVPDESGAGFRKISIAPQLVDALSWVAASKDTPYGRLSVKWKQLDKEFSLSLQIPVGCTATVELPLPVRTLQINNTERNLQEEITLTGGKYIIHCEK